MMFRFIGFTFFFVLSLLNNSYSFENKIIDFNLGLFNEDRSLGPHREARLFALADAAHPFSSQKEGLVLVHGTNADPKILQGMVNRLKDYQYQIYILAYSDIKRLYSKSGDDFSKELVQNLPREIPLTIVAHSAGGVITRRALNTLHLNSKLNHFGKIRFFSVDTPWHGFFGPDDNDLMVKWARYLIPDGYEEMRAKSGLLTGLFKVNLPSQVSIDIVFAQKGSQALDYSEKALNQVVDRMVEAYSGAKSIKLTDRQLNFWNALKSSERFQAFDDEMKNLFHSDRLNRVSTEATLAKHFPKFPGDHSTVISEQKSNQTTYLDYLESQLK